MSFRSDISVDYTQSPRIITVLAPSTELTMQDLHDTLVDIEDELINCSHKGIVSSAGKEVLDDVTRVAITMKLLNAKVGFEARLDWTQCKLSGGNLVAIDENGNSMNPINPTAFVNIDRTSSSSGTLQEQEALQYSSYQNAVWIDATSSRTGISFPNGTREYPVSNVQDAVLIGVDKGFNELRFIGDYTLGAGDDVTGFTLVGQNPTRTFLTLGDDAIISNVEIRECTLAGTLDGQATVRECVLWDINYFSGYIHHSVLTNSTIVLGNGATALFLHCYSGVAGDDTPTIDLGGSGQSLGLRNYNGGIKLINRTGTDGISLDINSGQVIIDSTCTAGDIHTRGVFKFTDNSGIGCSVYREGKGITLQDDMPSEVWSAPNRELTVAAGMTPAQEAKLDDALTDIATVQTSVDTVDSKVDGVPDNVWNGLELP